MGRRTEGGREKNQDRKWEMQTGENKYREQVRGMEGEKKRNADQDKGMEK